MKMQRSVKIRHYRILLAYLLRQWRGMSWIIALTVMSSAMAVAQPWPLKVLIDYALKPSARPAGLDSVLQMISGGRLSSSAMWVALAGVLGLVVLLGNAFVAAKLSMAWASVGQRSVFDLSEDMFVRLMRQDPAFFKHYSVGDCLSRLSGDTYAAYQLADKLLLRPLSNLITLIMVGVVSWRLNSQLTLLAFVVIPMLTLIALKYGEIFRKLMHSTRVSDSTLLAFTLQVMNAIPLIQAYQTESDNRRRFVQLAESSVKNAQRHRLYSSLFDLGGGSVGAISAAVILFSGSLEVLQGSMTVGSLVVILDYLNAIRNACNSLFTNFGGLKSLEASVERLFTVFDAPDPTPEARKPTLLPPAGLRGEIVFDGVTHRYGKQRNALDRLDLRIHPGETVAIVGPTGAGKSTLVGLLLRFFDPVVGRVLIDGIDIREMTLADLRSQIAYVPQIPMLAAMSVAANIGYSDACWDQETVDRCAREAFAYGFIQHLPKGYDSLIGSNSTRFSGGEKQRISLARALYQEAPILILDEPTSALDTLTEAELMASLRRIMHGRTVIMVAHRLSTIQLADRIVVLERGRIAEQGTHQQLIDSGGLYTRFHAANRSAGIKEHQ
ncbi:ABC transporter ATP-binding protein [Synechococcus sp. 1G10]|uniref:ABC transporter ATP-binding protein n=1 Tax=Synechococcus sp. 1G10 TaxID=2025605 RepID=UPI000B981C62|nr:ABC transporter ATP-binding protein [Synechococcus sp. 1G10]